MPAIRGQNSGVFSDLVKVWAMSVKAPRVMLNGLNLDSGCIMVEAMREDVTDAKRDSDEGLNSASPGPGRAGLFSHEIL
jgi:hypothetical protein